jgi:predicted GNAT family acetyltransferase
LHIDFEETSSKGRYFVPADDPDADQAELTFSKLGDKTIIADHTGVPDRYRGQGVGLMLVERMVEDARANGITIVPLCPFVRAMYEKHPEWSDVMQAPANRT